MRFSSPFEKVTLMSRRRNWVWSGSESEDEEVVVEDFDQDRVAEVKEGGSVGEEVVVVIRVSEASSISSSSFKY